MAFFPLVETRIIWHKGDCSRVVSGLLLGEGELCTKLKHCISAVMTHDQSSGPDGWF